MSEDGTTEEVAPEPEPRPGLCYLCGKPLVGDCNQDHVPPKQLYAKGVRRDHSPNLPTVRVHTSCNKGYQHDEDYFVTSLMPLANGSYSGEAIRQDHQRRYAEGKSHGLIHKVLREFTETTPGGIHLPGRIVKRLEGERIARVVWKITRGLYFRQYGVVLPEANSGRVLIYPPTERPPEEFKLLHVLPELGDYPGVLAYRMGLTPAENMGTTEILLWDRIIIIQGFAFDGVDPLPPQTFPPP